MTINFENYGKFIVYGTADEYTIEWGEGTLKECTDFIEKKMEEDYSINECAICDAETGEVIATITRDDEKDDYEYEPDYDECGFNPYMGCYDFDCQCSRFSPRAAKIFKKGIDKIIKIVYNKGTEREKEI